MPRADLRAIDRDGAIWTLSGSTLTRDTDDERIVLGSEIPCPVRGAYAMEFPADRSVFLVADARFHVRATRDAGFVVTPLCTDLAGAPWSRRVEGGWSFVANAWQSVGPGLLMTRDATGASGWFATTALDRTISAAIVDEHHSMLTLANGGHVILVDQVQTAAGEVLATHGELFSTLSRSAAGVVAARDAGDRRRVLLLAPSITARFVRIDATRDQSAPTRAVAAVDIARFVAFTDQDIELSVDRGRSFHTVFHTPGGDGVATALGRPSVGRLRDGALAVVTRDAVISEQCPAP